MGRKKIKIARISDDRNRSVTYLKRKAGLMKKAHELAILTGSEVAVIVFGQNGKLTEFCSSDMDRVLLRYTEHTGPVERKGPENYSNEDGEGSDDDGEGGDGDDGEGDADDADADGGGGGAAGGMGGSSGRHYSPPEGNRNGGRGERQEQAPDSAKSNKRKAPSGHKRKDGNGNSISSETSSKRGSPPYSSAPIIKVEGNEEESISIESNTSIDKGTLKAAIISRSGSRPHSGTSHHHSHSTGSQMRPRKLSPSSPSKSGDASTSPMPHRPYTADASINASASTQAIPFPQYSCQSEAGPSSRFAYSLDTSKLQPNNNITNAHFLQPQQWNDGMNPPQFNRSSSASAVGQYAASYGDLARGGVNSPVGVSYQAMHAGHTPMSPMQPQRQNLSQYSSLQLPMQMQGGQAQTAMIPLAHPILRQHPQYEQYANQLRMQQQTLGRNSMSLANNGIHTAPSSPNHLAMGDANLLNHNPFTSSINPGLDPSTARRSASFGYVTQQNDRRDFKQSLSNDFNFADNPFANDGQGTNLPQQDSGVSFTQSSIRDYPAMSAPPATSSFGYSSTSNSGDQQQNNDASISNADFNDLMGSIFSEMGSNQSTLSEPASGRSLQDSNDKFQESIKEQEAALRSMGSNGSLNTLVNSESFDAMMTDENLKIQSITSLDSPLGHQKPTSNQSDSQNQQNYSATH